VEVVTVDLLTASACKAWRACPRLYRLTYEDGYRPAQLPDALALGTLGHRGLEAWWRAARVAPNEPDAWWAAAEAELEVEQEPYQRARALSLMWGYHARWQGLTWQEQQLRVLDIEVEFSGPLFNPATSAASKTWARAGKIDALVEVGGNAWVVEHKTTSEEIAPGADYWQRLVLDAQVSTYLAGARLLGHEPAGIIYDVIRKPGLVPLRATPEDKRRFTKAGRLDARQRTEDEDPEAFYARLTSTIGLDLDAYFARAAVVRTLDEERAAAEDQWQTGVQIRDARRAGAWPRNPDACLRFGRRCDFFGVCSGVESLDDPTRFRRAETPHEELSMCRTAMPAAAE
jgi:hypothetical protein